MKKEKRQYTKPGPCKVVARDPFPMGEPDDIKAKKIIYGTYKVEVK